MKYTDLIRAVAKADPALSQEKVKAAARGFFEALAAEMARGGKVQVPGFGGFEGRVRPARTARNPGTGATMDIPERLEPAFRASSVLKTRVRGGPAPE